MISTLEIHQENLLQPCSADHGRTTKRTLSAVAGIGQFCRLTPSVGNGSTTAGGPEPPHRKVTRRATVGNKDRSIDIASKQRLRETDREVDRRVDRFHFEVTAAFSFTHAGICSATSSKSNLQRLGETRGGGTPGKVKRILERTAQAIHETGREVRSYMKHHAEFAEVGKRMLAEWDSGVHGSLRGRKASFLDGISVWSQAMSFMSPKERCATSCASIARKKLLN